jgi:hypothetical protein
MQLQSLRKRGEGTESSLWIERKQHNSDVWLHDPGVQGKSLDAECRSFMTKYDANPGFETTFDITNTVSFDGKQSMPLSSSSFVSHLERSVVSPVFSDGGSMITDWSTTKFRRRQNKSSKAYRLDPLPSTLPSGFANSVTWNPNQNQTDDGDAAVSAANSLLSASQPPLPSSGDQTADTMALLNRNTLKLKHLEKLNTEGGDLNADHVVEILTQMYPSQLSRGEADLMKTKALLESNKSKLRRLEVLERNMAGGAKDGGVTMLKEVVSQSCPAWLDTLTPLPTSSSWLHRSGY